MLASSYWPPRGLVSGTYLPERWSGHERLAYSPLSGESPGMQTLGERLQEARQRLGVTLREAAEFTKIRTDYLQSMEANQFESIPLADVYKRGFVKVYAKYLRLDDEKAGADFNTHHSAKASRRPLEAAADEDAPFEPASGVSSITLSRDTLVYAIIGIAVIAILLAFFI